MSNFSVEYGVAFDVLDAAINRCLSYMALGVVDLKREEVTHGSVVYKLYQEDLGKFGLIRIDKLSSNITVVFFREPSSTDNPFMPQQEKELREGQGSLENRLLHSIADGLGQHHELLEERKKHWDNVRHGLLQSLSRERIWPNVKDDEKSNIQKSTKVSKRGPNEASLDKVQRLAVYRQESIDNRGNIPGWIASCSSIGVDPKTVKKIAPILREKWEDKNFRWKDH